MTIWGDKYDHQYNRHDIEYAIKNLICVLDSSLLSCQCVLMVCLFDQSISFQSLFFITSIRYEEGLEFLYPDLQAEYNWWGSGNPTFVAGRIWDQDDDENLIEVNFQNAYAKNDSLLEGMVDFICKDSRRDFMGMCSAS